MDYGFPSCEVPVAVVMHFIDAHREQVVKDRPLGIERIIEVLWDAPIEIA